MTQIFILSNKTHQHDTLILSYFYLKNSYKWDYTWTTDNTDDFIFAAITTQYFIAYCKSINHNNILYAQKTQ